MNHNAKLNQTATPSQLAIAFSMAISTIFFVLFSPNDCKAALLAGVEICVSQLLFALFPFLIAANLLVLCGVAPILGLPLKPLCRLFGFREASAAGLLSIALLGGFAPAVSALNRSVRTGQISTTQASKLLPVLCFLGPSYIILAVGEAMLGNLRTGVYLFASQVLACFGVAILLRVLDATRTKHLAKQTYSHASACPAAHVRQTNGKLGCTGDGVCPAKHAQQTAQLSAQGAPSATPTAFTVAAVIGDSFFAFLRLCGVILYFQFLSAGICTFLPAQTHWLCQIALEVTAACGSIATLGYSASLRCCAALSLLSGSILLQISALCPKGVSCKRLLCSRLLNLPLSLAIFRLFLLIPQPQSVYSSLNERVIGMQRLPLDQALLLFVALLFLLDRLRKPLQRR